jgi:plasmid stability protein
MGKLTIRDTDDAVIDDLEAEARRHNRSLEAEVRDIPNRHRALRRRPTVEELMTLADKVAAMTPRCRKRTVASSCASRARSGDAQLLRKVGATQALENMT